LGRNGVSKGDTSSFYAIYKSLKETEKIRILIGIGITKETYDLLESTLNKEQQALEFSHVEAKEKIANYAEHSQKFSGKREVILSLYLTGEQIC